MDTHEDFLHSESRTRPLRLGVVTLALVAAALTSDSGPALISAGVLIAVYGASVAGLRLFLLRRFRSDVWIYGMLAGDAVFAGFALGALGPSGPALALPAFMAGYYALLLGYRGAFAAAAAGIVATASAAAFAGEGLAATLGIAVPLLVGVAGVAGLLGNERFVERERRRGTASAITDAARASRVVSSLVPVAAASTTDDWAEATAQALPAVSGFTFAQVYLRRAGERTLELAASTSPDALGNDVAALDEAKRAMGQGIASAISPEQLSEGLRSDGFNTGIAAPLVSGGRVAGAVLLISKRQDTPRRADLEQVEMYLSLATRFLLALEGRTSVRASEDRLTSELRDAGRQGFPLPRQAVELEGLRLDPASERSMVGGVAVSLSRGEFDLLYTLASAPGDVISPNVLTSASGGSGPVDVTIHRLRRKLSRCPDGDRLIRTVRGKGYMLVSSGS